VILGEDGRPLQHLGELSAVCPDCGSRPKDHTTYRMFGGAWRTLCNLCGHEMKSGTGQAPEEAV